MSDYTTPAERPVLVAASAAEDKRLIMEALDELALPGVLVTDGAEAIQARRTGRGPAGDPASTGGLGPASGSHHERVATAPGLRHDSVEAP
jgi:hypothetical protein